MSNPVQKRCHLKPKRRIGEQSAGSAGNPVKLNCTEDKIKGHAKHDPDLLAGSTGLEPAASGVTGRRYNHLNYDPVALTFDL